MDTRGNNEPLCGESRRNKLEFQIGCSKHSVIQDFKVAKWRTGRSILRMGMQYNYHFYKIGVPLESLP